jgi:hypothetical protein
VTTFTVDPDTNGGHMPEPSLADFLLARIAEDETQARELVPGRVDPENARWHTESLAMASLDDRQRRYVVKWAPPRVLAECEARRRIVERQQHAAQARAVGIINPASLATEIAWPDALRLLAAVYADHADYRGEWRPAP